MNVSVADEGEEAAAILSKFFNRSVKLVRYVDEKGRIPPKWNASNALNETAFADACVNDLSLPLTEINDF